MRLRPEGATSQDYQNAYSDLAAIGLKKVHKNSSGGNDVIPMTAAMGFFDGTDASAVRGNIRDRVKQAFNARRFDSEIFITMGANWFWIADAT